MKPLEKKYKDALSDLPVEVDVVQSESKLCLPSIYIRYAILGCGFYVHTRLEDDFDAHVQAIKSVIKRDITRQLQIYNKTDEGRSDD